MKTKLLASLFIAFAATSVSQGAVLYTSGTPGTLSGGLYYSDIDADAVRASKFTISTEVSITSLIFDGYYVSMGADDRFDINIMTNTGSPGVPGTVVSSATNLVATRSLIAGASYQHTVVLPAAINLTAGTYWISISGTAGDGSTWAWWTTAGTGTSISSATSTTTGYATLDGLLFTYQLNGNVVPEASSLLLGAFGALFLARRKRA